MGKVTVEPCSHELKSGLSLLIREAEVEDARGLITHVNSVGGESDYLALGPGEFELTEHEEAEFLRACRASENQVYLLALIGNEIVGTLDFSAGRRSRVKHSGELGMSVRKAFWGLGVGSKLLDALLEWARQTRVIKKINLRVRADNHRAILLYEWKGFVREGTLRKEVFFNGTYHDLYWMGLVLA